MEQTFQREQGSGGLLNTDLTGLKAYQSMRDRLTKIDTLEKDINTIRNEIAELNSLLKQLVTQK